MVTFGEGGWPLHRSRKPKGWIPDALELVHFGGKVVKLVNLAAMLLMD